MGFARDQGPGTVDHSVQLSTQAAAQHALDGPATAEFWDLQIRTSLDTDLAAPGHDLAPTS